MKKLLFLLLALTVSAPAFAQTQTQYYTVPTIAALKAMTTSRPAVVQVVDANPGIFNWSTTVCSAADDIYQITPTSGPTGCYTRMATPRAVGKSATANGLLCTGATGLPSICTNPDILNYTAPASFTTPGMSFNQLGNGGLSGADADKNIGVAITNNSSGTGLGSYVGAYIKQLGAGGSTASYLTGLYGEARAPSSATSGYGNYTGAGTWCGLEAGANVASCIGAEINVFSLGAGATTASRQLLRLADTSTGPTAGLGSINSVLRMMKVPAATGYAEAISINADSVGTDSGFPVAAGGTLLTASTTSLQLGSAIKLDGMAGGFSTAAVILPQGGTGSSIFFGAAGAGGQIISQATSNPGKLLFGSNSMTMQFGATNSLLVTNTGVTVAGTSTLSGALTYGGVALSNAVTGTGSMVLSAGATLTGSPVVTSTATSYQQVLGVTNSHASGIPYVFIGDTSNKGGLLGHVNNGGANSYSFFTYNGLASNTGINIYSAGGVSIGGAADAGATNLNVAGVYKQGGTSGIADCTVVTLGATITIKGGIITAFTGC